MWRWYEANARQHRAAGWRACGRDRWRLTLPGVASYVVTSRAVWYCVHGRESLPDHIDLRFLDGDSMNWRPENLAPRHHPDVTAGLPVNQQATYRRLKIDGHSVYIDAADMKALKARGLTRRWYVVKRSLRFYLLARTVDRKSCPPVGVAQLIHALPPGHVIRYRNGNPLDVRRRNLEVTQHRRRQARNLAAHAELLHPHDTTAQIRMHLDAQDQFAAEFPEPADGDLASFAADLDELLGGAPA